MMNVPYLGELALNPEVRVGGDHGKPIATRPDNDAHAAPFMELAKQLEIRCAAAQTADPALRLKINEV